MRASQALYSRSTCSFYRSARLDARAVFSPIFRVMVSILADWQTSAKINRGAFGSASAPRGSPQDGRSAATRAIPADIPQVQPIWVDLAGAETPRATA
jgi:hypothetical protein